MKHLTRTLALLLTLALLASCTAQDETADPSDSPLPVLLTYETYLYTSYYIPIYMQPNTVIIYGDDVSSYTVIEGGELTADEIAAREDVQALGVVRPETEYLARPNTKVTYDSLHGFIQNIYYEVPVGSGNYQLAPADATVSAEPSPDATPTSDALDAYLLEQEIKFREERELLICDLWLAADETRAPLARGTFFYMGGTVRDTDTHAGTLILATDEADTRHILRVSTPTDGDGTLLLEDLAFTDENAEWRSGENGSGCDAETAEHLISGAIGLFSFPGNQPVAGSEFTGEGLVIATLPTASPLDEDAQAYLIYLEAITPHAEEFDPPMQMFVGYLTHSQGNEGWYYAYNEGYGWSTLDG